MNAILLRIRLIEPLLMTQPLAGEENSASSLGYLPGSAMRGAVLRAYLRTTGKREIDLQRDEWEHRLFFAGGLKFLNGYPAHPESGVRSLPVPFSWLHAKDREEPLYDFSVRVPEMDEAAKPPKEAFFWRGEDEEVSLYQMGKQVIVHNASTDRNRKGVITSTVYRYEAIPAGEEFVSVILASEESMLKTIDLWLKDYPLTLGGSHTGGYGRVEVTTSILLDWQEYQEDEDTGGELITVTILSDTILRNQSGQVDGDLDRALTSALGLAKPLRHVRAYKRLCLAGGFNRKWGLPLYQEWALQAGSTAVYQAGDLDLPSLRKLAESGLGERLVEGYGRFAVNLNGQETLSPRKLSAFDRLPARPAPLSDESKDLARMMGERRLRALLDQGLMRAINRIDLKPAPENTQLSRLRLAAQQARARQNLAIIQDHLENLKGAVRQFERCRVGGDGNARLDEWIRARLKLQDLLAQFEISENDLPVVAGEKAELTEGLKVEYLARLLDGMMRKAARKRAAGGEG